jgi:hypothetical protein
VDVVFAAVAALVIAAGLRALQLNRAAQDWMVDHPKEWAIQFPEEAALWKAPPEPTPWLAVILLGIFYVMLVFLIAYGLHAWFAGDDAPHFEDKDADEQERLKDAASRLGHLAPSTPTVADTAATRRRGGGRRP